MALQFADRVRETSLTTGTGTFTLAGAQTGFVSFNAAVTSGNDVYYAIVNLSDSTYEIGFGTFTSPNQLARTAGGVLAGSSGSGTLVNFGSGTKDVFLTYPAVKAVTRGDLGSGFSQAQLLTSGTSWTVPEGVYRWRVTLVGAGGGGGGSATAAAGVTGNGGGSGAVVVGFYDFVPGQTAMTYAIGTAGTAGTATGAGGAGGNTTTTYNSVTYTAGGGSGGATGASVNGGGNGGTATGGTFSVAGAKGATGGTAAATNPVRGEGASTPLGWGSGGEPPGTAAGEAGLAGSGYGAGGSGGRNGSGTTTRAGGAGTQGVVLVEW